MSWMACTIEYCDDTWPVMPLAPAQVGFSVPLGQAEQTLSFFLGRDEGDIDPDSPSCRKLSLGPQDWSPKRTLSITRKPMDNALTGAGNRLS